jgi:hypothetical protein
MVDADRKRMLKWTPDWPLSPLRTRSANDHLPTGKRSANAICIVLMSAVELAAVLVAFHSTLGF